MCALTGRVSGASGSPIVGDPAVWTCMTNDSWIDDGLPTGEPQACASLSFGGSVRSEFTGSEGMTHTYDGGGLGDNGGEEGAPGADETHMCVWNDSTFSRIHNLVTRSSEVSLAVVLPARTGHDGDGLALQEEGTCTEGYEAKSRVTMVAIIISCSFFPLRN